MNEPSIDKYLLFEKLRYKPHGPEQLKIHQSTSRFVIPCCGRRFGKSQAVGHEITWRAFAPESYIWIVGPNYSTGEKEFRVVYNDFVRILKVKGVRKSYNVKQGDMRIELPWNTVIEVKSAEKQDGLVGEGLDYACMSEAALHLMSTWQQFIEPALSDKLGGAAFPSTPRGNNWYKGMYQLGQSPADDDYESWRFPSWFNTVRYPGGFDMNCPNIIQALGRHFPNMPCKCNKEMVRLFNNASKHFFLQEYAAEFTAREGKIYKDWKEERNVIDYVYNPLWRSWLTFDFGFVDPFCCYDIQIDQMDNVYIWREYQVVNKTTWEHAQFIKNRENPDGYHVNNAAADPRGADEIHTLQIVLNIPIQANGVGWALGVETVSRWLKPDADGKAKLFVDRSCIELIRQIGELQAPPVKEGKNSREGQLDYDDHGPDAIRYFFNEWQILGAAGSLEDVYSDGYKGSEAEGFFKAGTSLNLNKGF